MSKERYNQIIDGVYMNYSKKHFKEWEPGMNYESKESFINKCKTNPEFSEKWGLKIEERELSLKERFEYSHNVRGLYYLNRTREQIEKDLNYENIPTKLITLTYKNEKIESYE